jgi:hypothetical protein
MEGGREARIKSKYRFVDRPDRGEAASASPCLASGQPTCLGRWLRQVPEAEVTDNEPRRHHLEEVDMGPRLDRDLAEPPGEREETRRLVEWRRHRLRSTWGCRDFRRFVRMAARTIILGVILFITPGKFGLQPHSRVFAYRGCIYFPS